MAASADPVKPARGSIWLPFRALRHHLGAVLLGTLMVVGFCACKLALAPIIGTTIDSLGGPGSSTGETTATTASLRNALFLLIGIILVEATCRFFARKLIIDASRHVESRLKSDLTAHVSQLPLAWFHSAKTGDLLSRLTQDVELLRFLIGPTVLYGAQALVMVPSCIYMMTGLSSTVTLAISGAFGALLIAMVLLMPRLQKYSKAVQEDIAAISQHAQESFTGIHVLFHFGKTRVFARRLDELNGKYVVDNMAMTRFRALVHLFVHLCTDLVLLCVLVFGASEVIAGRMNTGSLFQFLILMGYLVWPLVATGWILGTVHRARSAADRIAEVLTTAPEPRGGRQVELRGDLRVQGLSFTYPDAETPALRDVSFSLPAGGRLGLVGAVGSGKSTLLHLILRLYDPPPGTVFVDDIDVLDLDLRTLRRLFAFAPQEPFLFSDTVADNIRFGISTDGGLDPAAVQRRVAAAIDAAALESDLDSLGNGIDTIVGERGVTLSGGQKQRVALARALAADRPAVILDDTLSAVDHETEARILDRLGTAGAGRSLLVASHRLSAVAHADLVLVLADGAIVERGDHGTLLRRGGLYADAWRLQREKRALGGDV